jgi:predicted  nucleic acid-binding Zn-ribbon protein
MNRPVVFNALWILSEKDASARHLTFSPGKNLLAGGNDTGKSRVLKHLVWALGCEPARRAAGDFDSNVVVTVDVIIGNRALTFVRQNRRRAAFDELGRLLFATESASAWAEFFAETFDFPLKLQRHEEGKFDYAGPGYAVMPFYVDQDNGWGTKWTTFTDLTQFGSWQLPVFNSFTGLKPAAYVRSQLQRDETAYRLRMAKAESKLQETSYQRVVAMLPSETTAIDETQFAQELRALSVQAQMLREEQDKVRKVLVELAQERQQKTAELQLALASERELVEDQAFLAGYKDDETLVCPTCSHVHTTTFYARQALAQDAHDIHEVVIRLQTDLDKLRAKELGLQTDLDSVATRLRALNESLNVTQKGRPVADVVVAKSLSTLKQAYDLTRRDLAAEIDTLAERKQALNEELAALTDKGREKRIKEFFAEKLISVADQLDINKSEISAKIKFSSRSPNASGSNAPRAVLAMHLTLLSTHRQFGEGPTFPFIVDTPQQSGQDPTSLGRMLSAILDDAMPGQTMVATESIPKGWQPPAGCKVLKFEDKRRLLQEDEFRDGVKAMSYFVTTMREAILKAGPATEEDADGAVEPPDAIDEDDDE